MVYIRKTAVEYAYKELKEAIIRGELSPGQRIYIEEWQERLGVSRTPIREAIRKLEAQQLIEKETNGWLYVKKISEEDIRNLYSVRLALEELAIVEAIERASSNEIEQLRFLQRSMEQSKNLLDIPKLGKNFHAMIYKFSRNPINQEMIKTIQTQIDRYRYLSTAVEKNRSQQAIEEHKAILRAILARDVENAKKLMRLHILNSRDTVIQSLQKAGGEGAKK